MIATPGITIPVIENYAWLSFNNDENGDRDASISPSVDEAGIFQNNWVKIMAVDVLVPCVARSSARILLSV